MSSPRCRWGTVLLAAPKMVLIRLHLAAEHCSFGYSHWPLQMNSSITDNFVYERYLCLAHFKPLVAYPICAVLRARQRQWLSRQLKIFFPNIFRQVFSSASSKSLHDINVTGGDYCHSPFRFWQTPQSSTDQWAHQLPRYLILYSTYTHFSVFTASNQIKE